MPEIVNPQILNPCQIPNSPKTFADVPVARLLKFLDIVADTAALLLPIPGGVGAAIKAIRGIEKVVKVVQTMDRTINTVQAAYNEGQSFGEGDIKSGVMNTTFAFLGAKGLTDIILKPSFTGDCI